MLNERIGSGFSWRPWRIYAVGILFYCFAYLLRVYPGIFGHAIKAHLQIESNEVLFGWLAAMYYVGYAPMQIPVGVCVDKLGPRFSLIIACSVSIVGAFVFAVSDSVALSMLGRLLIGFGTAFSYVTALKLASMWLPKRYFATATGAVTALGMTAAALSYNIPIQDVDAHIYSLVMLLPEAIGLVVLLLIVLIVRDRQADAEAGAEASAVSFAQLWSFLREIVSHKQVWLIGMIGCFLYIPSSVFLDVYAKRYLMKVHGLGASQAGLAIFLMFFGWIISSIASGSVSDMLRNRKVLLIFAGLLSCLFSLVLVLVPHLSVFSVYLVLFLLGASCGPHPLCFAMSKENFPAHVAGTAISFANFLIMLGGFLFQPLVAKLIEWHHGGVCALHADCFNAHDYHFAMLFMPLALFTAFLLSFFLKDTGRRDS
jgi:MFS family permease